MRPSSARAAGSRPRERPPRLRSGRPADQRCAGPVISITKTVEPEIASAGVETEFTYTITMTNEGTDDLKVRLILDTTSDDFEYVPFSVSSTPPSMVPGEPVTFPFWNTISWWFFGAGQTLATDTTWVLEFKATATLALGQYPNEVELWFVGLQLPPADDLADRGRHRDRLLRDNRHRRRHHVHLSRLG